MLGQSEIHESRANVACRSKCVHTSARNSKFWNAGRAMPLDGGGCDGGKGLTDLAQRWPSAKQEDPGWNRTWEERSRWMASGDRGGKRCLLGC